MLQESDLDVKSKDDPNCFHKPWVETIPHYW